MTKWKDDPAIKETLEPLLKHEEQAGGYFAGEARAVVASPKRVLCKGGIPPRKALTKPQGVDPGIHKMIENGEDVTMLTQKRARKRPVHLKEKWHNVHIELLKGRPLEEVAEEFDISVNTIYQHYSVLRRPFKNHRLVVLPEDQKYLDEINGITAADTGAIEVNNETNIGAEEIAREDVTRVGGNYAQQDTGTGDGQRASNVRIYGQKDSREMTVAERYIEIGSRLAALNEIAQPMGLVFVPSAVQS